MYGGQQSWLLGASSLLIDQRRLDGAVSCLTKDGVQVDVEAQQRIDVFSADRSADRYLNADRSADRYLICGSPRRSMLVWRVAPQPKQ